jgi:hypothetical protein
LPLTIRRPTIDEFSGLSDLCFRSKAIWGDDEKFILGFDLRRHHSLEVCYQSSS